VLLDGNFSMESDLWQQSSQRNNVATSGFTADQFLFKANILSVDQHMFTLEAGISMDAAGITFADGTYQDTAASGSTITAGAGMTLARIYSRY
jgi:hypothetical protein